MTNEDFEILEEMRRKMSSGGINGQPNGFAQDNPNLVEAEANDFYRRLEIMYKKLTEEGMDALRIQKVLNLYIEEYNKGNLSVIS